MKKLLYLIIAVLIMSFVVPVHAQKAYIGVLGGPNFADLDIVIHDETMPNHDIKSKTLFGIGGFFGISLSEYLSVQMEPMFLKKGGIYTESSIPDIRIKSNQLELPLILKAGIGENIRPYILGGAFLSFVLDASIETEMAGLLLEGDLTEIIKGTEFGAVLGAGISIPVWKGSAFIEGRYTFGLTNLNEGGNLNFKNGDLVVAGIQTDPKDEIKTRGVMIMIGYQLPLGGE